MRQIVSVKWNKSSGVCEADRQVKNETDRQVQTVQKEPLILPIERFRVLRYLKGTDCSAAKF